MRRPPGAQDAGVVSHTPCGNMGMMQGRYAVPWTRRIMSVSPAANQEKVQLSKKHLVMQWGEEVYSSWEDSMDAFFEISLGILLGRSLGFFFSTESVRLNTA